MLTDVRIDEFNERTYFLQGAANQTGTHQVQSENLVNTCCTGVCDALGCCGNKLLEIATCGVG
jgi:hypothetical protein